MSMTMCIAFKTLKKMTSFCYIIVVLFVIHLSYGARIPQWPVSYMVQGVLELPYAEIEEPFTAYWDAKNDRSRIDYYGKMVVTLQLGSTIKGGQSYKIVPMSTETVRNQKACFLVNGTAQEPIPTQAVLPDLSNFKPKTSEFLLGHNCTVWVNVTMVGGRKNTYTMWVDQTGDEDIPVKYEMMGYDTLLGSHYDKYYLTYDNFDAGLLPEDTFDIPKDIQRPCGDFPGPGDAEHRLLMNPMQEYVPGSFAHVDDMFNKFKKHHKKNYPSDKEHARRKFLFHHNLRFIHCHNRKGLSYTLAVNHLADFEDAELKAMRGRRPYKGYNGGMPFKINPAVLKDVPDTLDWRLYGAVTQVKDQAVCGSCWSFGTTGTIEGALFLKTKELVRLSQQALMDCSWGEGNNACDGGEDFRAYQWIMKHSLPTEDSYGPYLAQDGYCHTNNATKGIKLSGYVNITSGDLKALKVAIATKGPISVAIDASHKTLSFYSNGVYYDPECGNLPDNLDHAVLAVGYGTMNGQPYWLVKNSWSTYWGNDGYVLMSQKDNNCGVATDATYVIIGS